MSHALPSSDTKLNSSTCQIHKLFEIPQQHLDLLLFSFHCQPTPAVCFYSSKVRGSPVLFEGVFELYMTSCALTWNEKQRNAQL